MQYNLKENFKAREIPKNPETVRRIKSRILTSFLFGNLDPKDLDIVIGSRFLEKIEYSHGIMRRVGTKILSGLIKLICNKKITDPTSGFQCINRKTMQRFSKMGNYPEFPDANLIIELLLENYKIEEISTKMREREFGVSMHKGILKPIKYMIKVLYTQYDLLNILNLYIDTKTKNKKLIKGKIK